MNKDPRHPEKFTDTIKTRINTLRANGLSFISSDPLLKGIVILGSGTVISQVLSILFVPVLTRIYPPEVYGTLAVFTSLLTILLVGSSFKYELTIPIAENDEDAETLLLLSLLIACILSVLLFVVLTVRTTKRMTDNIHAISNDKTKRCSASSSFSAMGIVSSYLNELPVSYTHLTLPTNREV